MFTGLIVITGNIPKELKKCTEKFISLSSQIYPISLFSSCSRGFCRNLLLGFVCVSDYFYLFFILFFLLFSHYFLPAHEDFAGISSWDLSLCQNIFIYFSFYFFSLFSHYFLPAPEDFCRNLLLGFVFMSVAEQEGELL